MPVDRIEGFEQPLASFAVQIGDALAEPRNSLLNVGLLALHLFKLGRKLGLFLFRGKIDAAQPFAIAFQLQEPRLNFSERRDVCARLEPSKRETSFRRAVELLANGAGTVATALTRAFE